MQSLEKHILNLDKSVQSDLYTMIEHQQTTHQLKRTNWRLQQEKKRMWDEIQELKDNLMAHGVEVKEDEPEVDTAEEEEEPKPKRRNTISGREYRMLFSPDNINNFFTDD